MRVLTAATAGATVFFGLSALLGVAPSFARRRPRRAVSPMQAWLIQAGSTLTPDQFLVGSVAVGAVTFAVLWLVIGNWWTALFPAVAATGLLAMLHARRRVKRQALIQRAWPDAIRSLLSDVKAGRTIESALGRLARSGPAPLQEALMGWDQRVRLLGVVTALETVREELADPTSDRVVEVLIIASQFGGGMVAEVLEDLVDEIVDDLRVLETIRTSNTEQRIESWVVVLVPWGILLYLATVPDSYRTFYASGSGRLVVLVGAVWTVFGVVLMRSINRRQDEPRVLGAGQEGAGG